MVDERVKGLVGKRTNLNRNRISKLHLKKKTVNFVSTNYYFFRKFTNRQRSLHTILTREVGVSAVCCIVTPK